MVSKVSGILVLKKLSVKVHCLYLCLHEFMQWCGRRATTRGHEGLTLKEEDERHGKASEMKVMDILGMTWKQKKRKQWILEKAGTEAQLWKMINKAISAGSGGRPGDQVDKKECRVNFGTPIWLARITLGISK